MKSLINKKILLGITGGIAAYKIPFLIRDIIKKGGLVKCILTEAGKEFVTPTALKTLTKQKVYMDEFDIEEGVIPHTTLSKWPDVFVIAPATANTISKLADGIADNLLTLVGLDTRKPVLIVPSMHENMYNNEITQKNLEILKRRGFNILEPEEGELAGGDRGKGRLPEIERIVFEIEKILEKKDFLNKKIVVTAGATREYLDPVRFISNPSTGRMGFSLAREGVLRGGDVVLISGKTFLTPPYGINFIEVDSAEDMKTEVFKHFDDLDYLIMAAAVSDFSPSSVIQEKIKKDSFSFTLSLSQTPDILKEAGERKKNQKLVGFALETENLLENGYKKLKEKNLDMIVINKPTKNSGFEVETNKVTIILRGGDVYRFPLLSKEEVSKIIFDLLEGL